MKTSFLNFATGLRRNEPQRHRGHGGNRDGEGEMRGERMND
jgi:hypothetical protein